MAIGLASDFTIRPELYELGFQETIAQNVSAFNAASANTIRLVPQFLEGDYGKGRFFKRPATMISRRVTTSTSAATSTAITQDEKISVKLNRTIGPFEQTRDAFVKEGRDMDYLSYLIGTWVGDALLQEYLNYGVRAAFASLAGGSTQYDYSGTGTLNHTALVNTLAKMGDAAGRVKCWVGHSKPAFDLMGNQISVASGNVADMVIVEGNFASLGRPFVMSDVTNLIVAGTPITYHTLGLTEDAIVVTQSEEPFLMADVKLGLDNITVIVQGELAYNVEIKGRKWDEGNGGANPNDTAFDLGTNWDSIVASVKDGPGVIAKTQ